jgi:hypothetical protein
MYATQSISVYATLRTTSAVNAQSPSKTPATTTPAGTRAFQYSTQRSSDNHEATSDAEEEVDDEEEGVAPSRRVGGGGGTIVDVAMDCEGDRKG